MTEYEYHNAGNSEAQQRQALSFLLAQDGTGVATNGVLAFLSVTQTATASKAVLVNPGAAVAQANVLSGASLMGNDSIKTLDVLTGSPVGGLPRNDIIVFDAATVSIRAIIGTASASPIDPTVPASAVPLARLRHAASATTIPTSAIDDLRVTTTLFDPAKTPWTAYAVQWSTAGVFPLVNNGTLTGRYKDVGKTRFVHVEFIRGSTTQAGNDNYSFSLPTGSYQSFRMSGSGHYLDASPFTEKPLTVKGIGGNAVALLLSGGGRLRFDTIAWAAGDEIVFDLVAELA